MTAGNQYSFAISRQPLGEVFNNPYAGGTKLDDYAGIAPNSDIAFQVISSHTVGETAGTGTTLSDYTAVISGACAADGTVSLVPGDDKTCTITNTHKSHVVVTKVTDPSGDTTSFSIHAEGTGTITGSPNRTISTAATVDYEVTPGTYRVGELAQAGWDITGNTCQGLVVATGATVNCTITNTKKGHVVVTKVTDPVDNSTSFSLHAEGTGTITAPADRSIQSGTPQDFEVTPGTFRVGELAQAGWDQTGNDCHGLVVAAGATVPCTITNTKKATWWSEGDGPGGRHDELLDPCGRHRDDHASGESEHRGRNASGL